MAANLKDLAGFDYAEEESMTPLQKLYFSGEMYSKYEPSVDALKKLIDTEGEDEDAWNEFEETFDKFMDFSWCSNWDGKKYDIVFYGVSGYTGYLMMEYLKRTAIPKNPEKFTFAFAGRTVSKVAEMRDREFIGTPYEDTPIIRCSYDDVVSVVDLAKSAYTIVNVAGPYMLAQGETLIDACTYCGTNYCDVSGEIPWTIRAMDLHENAKKGQCLISPSTAVAGGYPDLLVMALRDKLWTETGKELRRATIYAQGGGAGGGTSGGTLATRAAMGSAPDAVRKRMADPYSLGGFVPDRDRNGMKVATIQPGTGEVTLKIRKEDTDAILSKVSQDPILGVWRAPHVYAYFDTRIVRRSNAQLADMEDRPYGRNLIFQEFIMLPPEMMMQAAAIQEAGGDMKGPSGPSVSAEKEALMAQGKYFKQGEGPPLEELGDAWTAQMAYAETVDGQTAKCSFVGRDGYYETARCAVEFAMTCRFDRAELPHKGGVLNGAVAGQKFFLRRMVQSGIKFKMGGWLEASDCSPPDF